MAKPVSEQLADLSVRAKSAEEAWARPKGSAREDRSAQSAGACRCDQGGRKGESGGQVGQRPATRNWNTVKAKIAADMNHLKADVAEAKYERDVKRAEKRADQLEWEAGFAIDYAIASVEQAKLAVLDAVDGRLAAEEAKQA